ncbi:MAG: preprotein translocase subunit SecG [Bacteroidota bacterium]|jgi:preprotein translocase subunit SecG
MESFIIVLIVIVSMLLGLIILVQNPKGGGLAVGFQGASQVGGVQRTTDFLEKATWYLGIALFALCLLSAVWFTKGSDAGDEAVPATQTEQTEGGTTEGTGQPTE